MYGDEMSTDDDIKQKMKELNMLEFKLECLKNEINNEFEKYDKVYKLRRRLICKNRKMTNLLISKENELDDLIAEVKLLKNEKEKLTNEILIIKNEMNELKKYKIMRFVYKIINMMHKYV